MEKGHNKSMMSKSNLITKSRGFIFAIAFVMTFGIVLSSFNGSANAESSVASKITLSKVKSSSIKLIKEFDKSQASKVFWEEAGVLKSISQIKSSDYKVMKYGVVVNLNAKGIAGIGGLSSFVIPLSYFTKVSVPKIEPLIREQVGENADKFVIVNLVKNVKYKGKSYQSFQLIPVLPWTDMADGYMENNTLVDVGTAEVGCQTLEPAVVKLFKIVC